MQYIRDIHTAKRKANQPVLSFEFFPPRTEEGDRNLLEKTIPALLQRHGPAMGARRLVRWSTAAVAGGFTAASAYSLAY